MRHDAGQKTKEGEGEEDNGPVLPRYRTWEEAQAVVEAADKWVVVVVVVVVVVAIFFLFRQNMRLHSAGPRHIGIAAPRKTRYKTRTGPYFVFRPALRLPPRSSVY